LDSLRIFVTLCLSFLFWLIYIIFFLPKIDFPPMAMNPSDVAFVLFSSGSTGFPKGVLITHQMLAAFAEGVCEFVFFLFLSSICRLVGLSVSWSLGWLVGWSLARSLGRSVGRSVGQSVGIAGETRARF